MIAFLAAFGLQPPATKSMLPDAAHIRFRNTREPIIASTDDALTIFPRCQLAQSILDSLSLYYTANSGTAPCRDHPDAITTNAPIVILGNEDI